MEHFDPEVAVGVRREHCDLALAVEGPARSGGRRKEEGRRKEAGWLT